MKKSLIFGLLASLIISSCSDKGSIRAEEIKKHLGDFSKTTDEYCACVSQSENNCDDLKTKIVQMQKEFYSLTAAPAFDEIGEELFSEFNDSYDRIKEGFAICLNSDAILRKVLIRQPDGKWLPGVRKDVCADGYNIEMDNQPLTCIPLNNIIWDGPPSIGEIQVGDSAVCEYSSVFWTIGIVTEINGSDYHLLVLDGRKRTVRANGIRKMIIKPDLK